LLFSLARLGTFLYKEQKWLVGVYLDKIRKCKKWRASITFKRKAYYLGGRHESKLKAQEAYNLKAKELFGISTKMSQ